MRHFNIHVCGRYDVFGFSAFVSAPHDWPFTYILFHSRSAVSWNWSTPFGFHIDQTIISQLQMQDYCAFLVCWGMRIQQELRQSHSRILPFSPAFNTPWYFWHSRSAIMMAYPDTWFSQVCEWTNIVHLVCIYLPEWVILPGKSGANL